MTDIEASVWSSVMSTTMFDFASAAAGASASSIRAVRTARARTCPSEHERLREDAPDRSDGVVREGPGSARTGAMASCARGRARPGPERWRRARGAGLGPDRSDGVVREGPGSARTGAMVSPAGRRGRVADHERRLQPDVAWLPVGSLQPLEHQLRGRGPDLVVGDVNRGQGRLEARRERHVVEADDRDLPRTLDPTLRERVEAAKCQQVVRGGDGAELAPAV